MSDSPPDQFEGFCVGFDVALYSDTPAVDEDFENCLQRSIDYGLGWCDRNDLLTLRDFPEKNII